LGVRPQGDIWIRLYWCWIGFESIAPEGDCICIPNHGHQDYFP